jgi:hypothetical protein
MLPLVLITAVPDWLSPGAPLQQPGSRPAPLFLQEMHHVGCIESSRTLSQTG